MLLVAAAVIAASGCVSQNAEKTAVQNCTTLCWSYPASLENGPCISDDNSEWAVSDWACDAVHNPRENVDNLPENQCQAFRNGKVHHFVEVDTNCSLVRMH